MQVTFEHEYYKSIFGHLQEFRERGYLYEKDFKMLSEKYGAKIVDGEKIVITINSFEELNQLLIDVGTHEIIYKRGALVVPKPEPYEERMGK